ncbi:MAG: hypothetical protein Q9217_005785 [Psora testacea]
MAAAMWLWPRRVGPISEATTDSKFMAKVNLFHTAFRSAALPWVCYSTFLSMICGWRNG